MENGISLAPRFQRFSSKLHNTDYLHGRQEREREREREANNKRLAKL